MNLQQLNPKIISITQVRRDIDILHKVLSEQNEAFIVKNQRLLFIAVSPEKYQAFSRDKKNKIERAIVSINKIRNTYKSKTKSISRYVMRMRDERMRQWIK